MKAYLTLMDKIDLWLDMPIADEKIALQLCSDVKVRL